MASYYNILTTLGLTRLTQSIISDVPMFIWFAVGDGNGAPVTPDPAMTALVRERARVAVNVAEVSPSEPRTIRVEGRFPAAIGGFTIREAGIFNAANELIAVASYPPTYKPTPAEGAIVDEYIRMLVVFASANLLTLSVDPAVVVATRLDVEDATAGNLYLWEKFS